jgi:hypothetical protein
VNGKGLKDTSEGGEAAYLPSMSQEPVETIRRQTEAYNAFMSSRLSSEAYAECFDTAIEVIWRDQQTYPDFPQQLRGISELIEFSEEYRDRWSDLSQEVLELIEAPNDRVLTLIRQSGRGRQSGVPITIHFFTLLTVRDGKAVKVEYFRHRADALRAADLEE